MTDPRHRIAPKPIVPSVMVSIIERRRGKAESLSWCEIKVPDLVEQVMRFFSSGRFFDADYVQIGRLVWKDASGDTPRVAYFSTPIPVAPVEHRLRVVIDGVETTRTVLYAHDAITFLGTEKYYAASLVEVDGLIEKDYAGAPFVAYAGG